MKHLISFILFNATCNNLQNNFTVNYNIIFIHRKDKILYNLTQKRNIIFYNNLNTKNIFNLQQNIQKKNSNLQNTKKKKLNYVKYVETL